MEARILTYVVIVILIIGLVYCETNGNEIATSNPRPEGWMKSAHNILAGPAGQMVVQVAKELISRSTGSSQILSLNLGNLMILLLLKALIFAAGVIGAGNWSHYARRLDNEASLIEPGEPLLLIGYLAAQGSGQDGCLHKAACRTPRMAYEYARAAKALLNGIEMFQGEITDKKRYQGLIDIVEKSAYDGFKGAPCDLIYRCNL